MQYFVLVFLILMNVVRAESVEAVLPRDVAEFVERRDGCDHFRGEEPYDEERRAYIEKNILELCTGTDKQINALKDKYKNNAEVMTKLNEYEPSIEFVGEQ